MESMMVGNVNSRLSRTRLCLSVATVLLLALDRAHSAEPARDAAPREARVQRYAESAPVELERLKRAGEFEQFVASAERLAVARPADVDIQLQAIEAHLAVGRADLAQRRAEQWLASEAVQKQGKAGTVARIAKLWATACFRQSQPLSAIDIDQLAVVDPQAQSSLAAVRYWQTELSGRSPYRRQSAQPVSLPLKYKTVYVGRTPHKVEGVSLSVNGTLLPMAFIDTGAQYTLMSTGAAQAAGVVVGPVGPKLVGFAASTGTPALVRSLAIGELRLADVPVLVGDFPALDLAQGQIALGTDVLHHLQVTIDYPARRVDLAPPTDSTVLDPTGWQIPLWTFPQAALAVARLDDGRSARVLLDTGNRMGAYVSKRFDALTSMDQSSRSMRFPWSEGRSDGRWQLAAMELGSRPVTNISVRDRLPEELDRLHLVDVLLGHDMLARHRVTIDLAGRRLLLDN